MSKIDLQNLTLEHGAHPGREHGVCLMEAFAWWRDLDHTDHPACVSPVIGEYGRQLNDHLSADGLAELARRTPELFPLMMGTAGDGQDMARAWLCADRAARVFAPAALDAASAALRAAGLADHADSLAGHARALRELPEASAAWSAARSAGSAGSAARSAAIDLLRDLALIGKPS